MSSDRYRQQHPEEDSIVTGYFQRRIAEGVERGHRRRAVAAGHRAEGIEQKASQRGHRSEGRAEGGRTVLERLLLRRFGRLPPEAAERLHQAPAAELETWADNVLDAETLDEVFRSTRP